jgi:gamma-glutamylcyclotransferase (GGCT)/AIG2-like uncharacterized protein YtfP
VRGEVYETTETAAVLSVLDEIEGYRAGEPDRSLYTRVMVEVTLDADGDASPAPRRSVQAWTYFYNAPLGRAQRIASGDYLEHLNAR